MDAPEMTTGGLAVVAAAGDTLATLRALRDRLASDLDVTDSKRDVASLSARFLDVLSLIAEIEGKKPQSDEKPSTALSKFEEKLRARQSGTAGSGQAGR